MIGDLSGQSQLEKFSSGHQGCMSDVRSRNLGYGDGLLLAFLRPHWTKLFWVELAGRVCDCGLIYESPNFKARLLWNWYSGI